MNDSEIIKGLECCYKTFDCETCPYNREDNKRIYLGSPECKGVSIKDVVDLIHRQQAEIDRLNIEINIEAVKSEAVREFAESLKRKSELVAPSVWAIPYRAVAVADIDKLLEEMGCNDG